MSYYESPNPNENPGAMGLKLVADIEYSSGSYEFDTRVVWADKDGKLLTARDSGCSCPTPFAEFDSIDKLDPVDYDELARECADERAEYGTFPSISDVQTFLARVRVAMQHPQDARFVQEDHDADVAEKKATQAIQKGLSAAANALGIPWSVSKVYEITPVVPRGLTAAQSLILGVFLTNVAEQQLGVPVTAAPE